MTQLAHSRPARLLIPLLIVSLTGCSDQNKSRTKSRRFEGVAKSVDLETQQVSMLIQREDGEEREFTAHVRDDTVIRINGRSQALGDVRSGDKVVAYVEKDKGEGEFIVRRVEIERATNNDWKEIGGGAAGTKASAEVPKSVAVSRTPATPDAGNVTTPAAPAPVVAKPAAQAPSKPTEPLPVTGRTDAEDLVYGLIRVKMEEAVEERSALLAAGTKASDTKVRELEGLIMKARDLLLERGEILENVDPPIVEQAKPRS